MSILLEALKKSEAQRQLGKTPTLDSPVGGESPAGGIDRIWAPAVMLLLAFAIISWIGLEQFRRPESVASSALPAPTVGQQQTEAEKREPEDSKRSARAAKTPVMDFSEPSRASSPDTKAAARSGAGSRMPPTAAKPVAAKRRPTAAVSTVEESSAVAAQDDLMSSRAEQGSAESQTKETDRVETSVPDSISYWQMPQSVRGDLPELHISVLVYAEDPEDRFLLINGQRLQEKEELESGMVLDEIQRDRAIFHYRDYRFYLKN